MDRVYVFGGTLLAFSLLFNVWLPREGPRDAERAGQATFYLLLAATVLSIALWPSASAELIIEILKFIVEVLIIILNALLAILETLLKFIASL